MKKTSTQIWNWSALYSPGYWFDDCRNPAIGNRTLSFRANKSFANTFAVIGIIMIFTGGALWYSAVFHAKVDSCIKSNTLATTGIYAYVRNPIYSAILIACTGALFLANNLWLLILPFVFWVILTVMMIYTEEKWLKRLYGKEYEEYCKRVNRCIPKIRAR